MTTNQPAFANASIYVGELSSEVTEANLFEVFSQAGPVSNIRVCRDAMTRRSLGYGYVNFMNSADAERALETLNYISIKDRPCRLMWSQRDPALRKTGVGNIFIKNLDPSIDSKQLHDTLSEFGNILSCKVNKVNDTTAYGFVHFENAESAKQAVEQVNGMELLNRKVSVTLHVPKKERTQAVDPADIFTNVYVKNLSTEVSDEEFRQKFAAFGTITSATITRDENGLSKGFGFVNFVDHASAARAVNELNETDWAGKKVFLGRAQKKAEREAELRERFEKLKLEKMNKYQGVNLYVKNLDERVDDEKLREEFGIYGIITSATVMRDDKGVHRGFGFVCFSAAEEATKAVSEMNGKMIFGKPIYVALAQRKTDRQNQLAAQFTQKLAFRPPLPGGAPIMPMYYSHNPVMPPQARQPGFLYPQQMASMRARFPPNAAMAAMGNTRPAVGYPPVQGFPMPMGPQRPLRQRAPRPPTPALAGARPPMNGLPGLPVGNPVMMQGMNANNLRRGFKYNPNVRNKEQVGDNSMGNTGGSPGSMTTIPVAPQNVLNAAALAAAAPEQRKQILGEHIFPIVQSIEPVHAGKVTGMLLEMDSGELLHLLDHNRDALEVKIEEARHVLLSHLNAKQHSTSDQVNNDAPVPSRPEASDIHA